MGITLSKDPPQHVLLPPVPLRQPARQDLGVLTLQTEKWALMAGHLTSYLATEAHLSKSGGNRDAQGP